MILKIFKKLIELYRKMFWPLEKQARNVGVHIGEGNFIASRFWSTEPYLITIGNNCQITAGVKMFTHGGAGAARKQYPTFDTFGKVIIGDYVYLGNNTLVMPGVTIGNNVLVAAGSVVTKSIPDNVVVGGNPAKYIGKTEDFYKRLKEKYDTSTGGMQADEKKHILLSLPEEKFETKKLITIPENRQ